MRTKLLNIALACTLLVGFPIQSGAQGPIPTPLSGEVTRALQEGVEAWNAGNLPQFLNGYLDSPDLTYTSSGRVIRGFQTLQKRYQDTYGKDKQSMGRLRFDQIEVWPLGGDYALALGRWHLELAKAKTRETVEGVFSLVLRKTPQGWKILHDHTSKSSEAPKA